MINKECFHMRRAYNTLFNERHILNIDTKTPEQLKTNIYLPTKQSTRSTKYVTSPLNVSTRIYQNINGQLKIMFLFYIQFFFKLILSNEYIVIFSGLFVLEKLKHKQKVEKVIGGGNGNPLQYSCLEKSMDRGAWRAAVHGVT